MRSNSSISTTIFSSATTTGPSLLRIALAPTNTPGGVVIYPHGYSARYRLLLSKAAATAALSRIGWHPGNPRDWTTYKPKSGNRRYVLKGTAWLTHAAPRNRRKPLARFNSRWKSILYGIAIDETPTHFEMDVLGVRIDDVKRLFERVLGLTPDQYILLHYRAVERYIVLDPPDAHRFALARQGRDRFGAGRYGKKRFLIHDQQLDVPVRIRKRAKAHPVLSLYRIEPGATAAFRLEVRLRGQRGSRGEFHEKDIAKLDEILLDLVSEHGLTSALKPARWEPRALRSPVERAAPDPQLGRIPLAAYRGRRLSPAQLHDLRKCHTPQAATLIATSQDLDAFPRPRRVRREIPPSDASATSCSTAKSHSSISVASRHPDVNVSSTVSTTSPLSWKRVEGSLIGVALYRREQDDTSVAPYRRPTFACRWKALAHDIASFNGYLSEVVLDAEESPVSLISALVGEVGGKIGVAAIAVGGAYGHADTWQPLMPIIDEHPLDDDIKMLVLVFDASISAEAEDKEFLFNENSLTWMLRPGIECRTGGKFDEDPLSRSALPLGATYWPILEGLRDAVEKTGTPVVLITTDFRRPTGIGDMRQTHYYTDARVRSLLGDAARYYCHQRYRVEVDGTIVTLKDEGEGRTGRPIHRQ